MNIQRYLPTTIGTAFTGMKPAVEGGDYVLYTDHAAIVSTLYEALEVVEWMENDVFEIGVCPCCNGQKEHGHHDDCKLNTALRAARGEG